MKKKNTKQILFYVILTVGIIVFLWLTFGGSKSKNELKSYSELRELFVNRQVQSFQINDDNEIILLRRIPDGQGGFVKEKNDEGKQVDKTEPVTYQLRDIGLFYNDFNEMIAEQKDAGIIESFEYEPIPETPWWLSFLPYLGFLLIIGVFWFFMMNQATGGKGSKIASFGKARAKVTSDQKRVKFSDVAGADEEKEELTEVVDFLKNPARYVKLGARIPRGVLLVGPPGTGKTLLAKAVAGEAGVPFFSISGSDFVEMYVGVGASRVRDLFDTAKKAPASIIFIDEIDAVGRHRGAGLGGGHDEREQTLNQLLVEMDGFGSSDGVIVMAATNRPDILDPALLRPGRFDRQVTVNYPDMKGREEILKVHAVGKPIEETVDFHHVAQTTVGFTGADLANLLNEAALLAARRGKSMIGNDEINDSYMKIIVGPKKKSKIREEKDNRLTAYHEAGHAVASYFCDHSAPVKHITIIPAGRTGGVTVRIPEKDFMCQSRNEMFDDIVIALGGRVAEELNLDDISTGASNDIQQATAIARNMVVRYGMSEKLGPVLYGSEHTSDEVFLGRDFSSGKNYSEKTAAEIDDEIRAIIEKAYAKCREILSTHSDKLKKLAEYLLHAETVDGDQFKALMESDTITEEELDAIVAEKKKKSDAENEAKRRLDDEKSAEEQSSSQQNDTSQNPFGSFPFNDTEGPHDN